MTALAIWWLPNLLNVGVILLGLMLIALILLQEGKGGGLTGALGGGMSQTPLGYRAADSLVKVTIGLASVWVFLIVLQIWTVSASVGPQTRDTGLPEVTPPAGDTGTPAAPPAPATPETPK